MIEFDVFRRILNLSRDILFCWLYLNTVDQPRRKGTAAALSPLILTFFYAMFGAEDGGFFAAAEVRLIYRGLCLFACLMLSRQMDWKLALYDALWVDCICIISHNVFLTPMTRPILLGSFSLTGNSLWDPWLCLMLVQIVNLPLLVMIYRVLPLRQIIGVSKFQAALLLTIAACSLYLNSMLRLITDNQMSAMRELSVFSILLQFALLMCLILMEKGQYNLRRHASAQIQLSHVRTTLEIARHDQQADARIRKIHHDLKNHISSLGFLLDSCEYDKARAYLDEFKSALPVRRARLHTGSLILDSLLAEKIARAEQLQAEVMIAADLSPFSAFSDFDLCTIFGNAMDNAIEACAQVSQPENRYIHLRRKEHNGFNVFTLANSYAGERRRGAAFFRTTKKGDGNDHGYGLSNASTALAKYGGILSVTDQKEKHEFQLNILLPRD